MTATAELPRTRLPLAPTGHGEPVSVCLLISSLEFGGAERQVVEMVRSFDRNVVRPFVCSLSSEVPLARFLPEQGKELSIIKKRGRFDLTTVLRLARLLRRHRADAVHAFLLDAEIAARLAAPLAGVPVVIASERNADYSRPRLHSLALRATQRLFDVMVSNSVAGKNFNMRTLGLAESRIEVVHNGVDVEKFCPDRPAGLGFREQIGISPSTPLFGMVGSYKRQKGQDCFLRMAARVRQDLPTAHFLLVGEPLRDDFETTRLYQAEVKELANSLRLTDCCHFVGNQHNMKAVYNACDVTALLSRHEGTPNVILESMACGVPVIATNVADNAIIIREGKTGFVIPREDYNAAAAAAIRIWVGGGLLKELGEGARKHAVEQFSLRVAASKLENIYTRCLREKRGANRPSVD